MLKYRKPASVDRSLLPKHYGDMLIVATFTSVFLAYQYLTRLESQSIAAFLTILYLLFLFIVLGVIALICGYQVRKFYSDSKKVMSKNAKVGAIITAILVSVAPLLLFSLDTLPVPALVSPLLIPILGTSFVLYVDSNKRRL